MKKLYSVTVTNGSESCFEEYYSDEEIKTIEKFFNDMSKNDVATYDFPLVEFEIDGETITIPNFVEED